MDLRNYILVGRKIVTTDLMTSAEFFEDFGNRLIAKTHVGNLEISTVFLSIDHRIFGEGPPVLFETMVFNLDDNGAPICNEELDRWTNRYCTFQQSVNGHNDTVDALRKLHKQSKVFQYVAPKPDYRLPQCRKPQKQHAHLRRHHRIHRTKHAGQQTLRTDRHRRVRR